VIFATPKGEEIDRIVGLRDPDSFFSTMDSILPVKTKGFSEACAGEAIDELWRCALICGDRKDKACAESAYGKLEKKLAPGSMRYLMARTYFVDNAPNEDMKRDGYERLLAGFPKNPLAPTWGVNYLSLFQSHPKIMPKTDLVEKVLSQFDAILADKSGDEAGIVDTDQMEAKAQLLQMLGRKEESQKAWLLTAGHFAQEANALPRDVSPKGFVIEQIECLEMGGQIDKALELGADYRAKYPKEFTFHFKVASMLERAKRFNDALPIAQKAFEFSYGDNRIRAAILLLRLYATQPNRAAAEQIYKQVTREQTPQTKLEIRTFDYLKTLDETWKRTNASS
jgi:hypothetical protein